MKKISRSQLAALIVIAILLIDQCVKIAVKTHLYLGESINITSWFKIAFVENNGAAFGMQFGDKLFLTIFRIIAAGALAYYLRYITKHSIYPMGYIACVALIEAGAIGNIIDCLLYGLIFNAPIPPQIATLFPPEGGYAGFFYGRVVDMLYFPLFQFYWPDWMPFIGGELFEFFRPVFNIADSAITIGVICIILFYYKYLITEDNKKQQTPTQNNRPD